MNIGQRIKERRRELHMSADKLAELIGKDRSTIFRYEKGDIENLPLDVLEPIAAALHTTPQYLMGWVDKEVSQKNGVLTDIFQQLMKDDALTVIVQQIIEDDALADTVMQLKSDEELHRVVRLIAKLDAKKRQAFMSVLNAFLAIDE